MKWVSGDGLGLHGAQSALIMRIMGHHSVAIHVSLDGCAGRLGQSKAEGRKGKTLLACWTEPQKRVPDCEMISPCIMITYAVG